MTELPKFTVTETWANYERQRLSDMASAGSLTIDSNHLEDPADRQTNRYDNTAELRGMMRALSDHIKQAEQQIARAKSQARAEELQNRLAQLISNSKVDIEVRLIALAALAAKFENSRSGFLGFLDFNPYQRAIDRLSGGMTDEEVAELATMAYLALSSTSPRAQASPGVPLVRVAAARSVGAAGKAAETTTARLQGHMQSAMARVEAEGLTAAQQRALIKNPGLEAAYRGDRIDTLFKDAVRLDPKLQHLEVTPRYKFGPDVFDPATQKWWDVTTPAQWQPHVEKYWLFGEGTPLLTR